MLHNNFHQGWKKHRPVKNCTKENRLKTLLYSTVNVLFLCVIFSSQVLKQNKSIHLLFLKEKLQLITTFEFKFSPQKIQITKNRCTHNRDLRIDFAWFCAFCCSLLFSFLVPELHRKVSLSRFTFIYTQYIKNIFKFQHNIQKSSQWKWIIIAIVNGIVCSSVENRKKRKKYWQCSWRRNRDQMFLTHSQSERKKSKYL